LAVVLGCGPHIELARQTGIIDPYVPYRLRTTDNLSGRTAMDGIDKSSILKSEQYQQLIKRRARYAWSFALVTVLSLVIFIGLAVWMPDFYARQLFPFGFFSVGMAAGLLIFIVCISLTGIYLYRCSVEFEPLQKEIIKKHGES
jgi:uncharacterized membrane protein (DUF485 family)